MNSIAIYTALFGGYDTLKEHLDIPGVDFIAFTDDETLATRDDWRVVVLPPSGNPRLDAKFPKIVGPQSAPLDRYEATIWIDATLEILTPAFAEEAVTDLGPDGLAFYRSSPLGCIYQEAAISVGMPKYAGQPILEQVEHYRSLGHPDHSGLWPCAVIGRSRSPRVDALMSDWMAENERWTLQDQISLPFVLRQHDFTPHEWPHEPPDCPEMPALVPNPWLLLHYHDGPKVPPADRHPTWTPPI